MNISKIEGEVTGDENLLSCFLRPFPVFFFLHFMDSFFFCSHINMATGRSSKKIDLKIWWSDFQLRYSQGTKKCTRFYSNLSLEWDIVQFCNTGKELYCLDSAYCLVTAVIKFN